MLSSKVTYYVKIFVGIFFAGIGLFYVLYPHTMNMLSPNIVRIIGIIFIARGIFRAYSAYKNDFQKE